MKERIINTDKLDEKYGIKGYKAIEKLDVYMDMENHDNCWAMAYYNDFEKGKKIPKEEIIRFNNKKELEEYIKNTITRFELTHLVPEEEKQLHVHYIAYSSILYYMHEGHPDKNYIVLNYSEYKNGNYFNRQLKLPKEYEKPLLAAMSESKKYDGSIKNDSRFYHLIDVRQRRMDKREDTANKIKRTISMPVNNFLNVIKQNKITENKEKIVKGLKIVASSTLVAIILSSGYSLVKNLFKGKVNAIDLKLPTNSKTDSYVRKSTDRATNIIQNLIYKDKGEVTREDLEFIVHYLEEIGTTSFDKNSSYSVYNYESYFLPLLSEIEEDTYEKYVCQNLINKISKMYEECITVNGKKVTINKDACQKFFQFVSSLSYANEVEYRDLPFNMNRYSKSVGRPGFANASEVNAYRALPPVVKLVILTQLSGIEKQLKLTFKDIPKYYFGKNNYDSINRALNSEIKNTARLMYDEFSYRYSGKAK